MKRTAWILLALGLVASGCILTSGQIELAFDLSDVVVTSPSEIEHETINLNDKSEYTKNKDKLKDLSDLAVLGKFTNNGSGPINVEVWMTTDSTSYSDATLMKADSHALKLWGPFAVAAGATRVVDWNESAKLFTPAGKAALLNDAKSGDGIFTLYAIGDAGTYQFKVENGVLVLVIDAGI